MSDKAALYPALKDVVFLHIPKTAGTSLHKALTEALADHSKIFDYGDHTKDIPGDFINAAERNISTAADVVALRDELNSNRRLFVSGHFSARKYLTAFHPASFVTFLRDPVERAVSDYKHRVRYANFTGSLAEFCEMPKQINVQSRLLWDMDLRNMGFIGLTEFMPDMVDALSRHLGVPLKVGKENVGSRFGGPKVDEKMRARILALNDNDVRLYQHVKAHLDDYTNLRSRSATRPLIARGVVTRRGNGRFRGKVTTFEPGRLAEIEVKAASQVVHRCYADEYLISKQAGNPQNRSWGFSADLPVAVLAGQTQVRFVFAGTDADLAGSPVTINNDMPVAVKATR